MARKRVSGRARQPSQLNKLVRNVEKANTKLNRLQKSDYKSTFSSRKLISSIYDDKNLTYDRKSRNKIKIKNIRDLTPQEVRLYNKQLERFNASKTSSAIGMQNVIEKTKEEMYKTLARDDQTLTRKDIDDYYEMLADKDFDYLSDKIGSSEVWTIIEDARESNKTPEQFADKIKMYVNSNDQELVEKASRLYNKFIK